MASGPNRHYIPAFLQRGFAISRKVPKKKQKIWQFGFGQASERRLIKKTGSENFFYSDLTDDLITQMETDLAKMLEEIRHKNPGELVNAEAAAAIVSHLSVRTAHVRQAIRDVLTRTIGETRSAVAEPSNIAAIMGLDADAPTDRFRELVMAPMVQDPNTAVPGIPPRVFERHVFFLLKENSESIWGPSPDLDSVFMALDEYQSRLAESISDSHDKALGACAVEICDNRDGMFKGE